MKQKIVLYKKYYHPVVLRQVLFQLVNANEVRDSVVQKALSFYSPKTNVIATSKVRTKVASLKKIYIFQFIKLEL